MTAKYITVREAGKKYGFTLMFLRNKIFNGLLDSRKEYVKYKPPHNANGSHCMRQVIVVNEDQVRPGYANKRGMDLLKSKWPSNGASMDID